MLVLIVEDEPKIAQILVDFLVRDGFDTHVLDDGAEVVAWVREHAPDFVVLDLMLPNKDGLTICREVRSFSEVPIVMVTARVEEIDRLMGLGFGADDYVCKPFSAREVVARIHAILRRTNSVPGSDTTKVSYKSVSIDTEKFTCCVAGTTLNTTPVEFRMLVKMLRKPGVVFSREQLMLACYEDGRVVSDRTIDSHMKNLRQKIQSAAPDADLLHSVYGVGYKIE